MADKLRPMISPAYLTRESRFPSPDVRKAIGTAATNANTIMEVTHLLGTWREPAVSRATGRRPEIDSAEIECARIFERIAAGSDVALLMICKDTSLTVLVALLRASMRTRSLPFDLAWFRCW